jgi:hypothetical protein
MATLSTARKLGILARVVGRHTTRTRTFGAVLRAGRATAAHWGRALHLLWLEVTGFVFLSLAAIGAIAFVREMVKYENGKAGVDHVIVAILFTVMFAWFGVSSFWRVRRKNSAK